MNPFGRLTVSQLTPNEVIPTCTSPSTVNSGPPESPLHVLACPVRLPALFVTRILRNNGSIEVGNRNDTQKSLTKAGQVLAGHFQTTPSLESKFREVYNSSPLPSIESVYLRQDL